MEKPNTYLMGEWIVHSQYGVGQIKGVDVNNISGDETRYFRVQTLNSTFWVPTEQMNNDKVRPLSTSNEIKQVITILQEPPNDLSENHKIRQKQIARAKMNNTLIDVAQILRDLQGYQQKKGTLVGTDRNAFQTLKKQLANEWALIEGVNIEMIELKISTLLD